MKFIIRVKNNNLSVEGFPEGAEVILYDDDLEISYHCPSNFFDKDDKGNRCRVAKTKVKSKTE